MAGRKKMVWEKKLTKAQTKVMEDAHAHTRPIGPFPDPYKQEEYAKLHARYVLGIKK